MGAIPTLAGEDKRLVQIRFNAAAVGDPCGLFVPSALCVCIRPLPGRAAGTVRHGSQAVACHLYDAPPKESAA